MTAFGKLIRTTAFRLTLVYLFLFALFAASLLGYFAWNTRRLITEQIITTVDAETEEVSGIYDRRGLSRLVFTVESRALRPGANLYLVTTPTGQLIAGNVGALMPGVMASSGWIETAYRRLDDQDNGDHRALVYVTQLDNGFRLLVGRDLEERHLEGCAGDWGVDAHLLPAAHGACRARVAKCIQRPDRIHVRCGRPAPWRPRRQGAVVVQRIDA